MSDSPLNDLLADLQAGCKPALYNSDIAKLTNALLKKNQNTAKMQGSLRELLLWQAELDFREAGKRGMMLNAAECDVQHLNFEPMSLKGSYEKFMANSVK